VACHPVATHDLPRSAAHPFYARLNQILDKADFDGYVERLCQRFDADKIGPSWSTVKAIPTLLNEPPPDGNVTSPSARPTFTNTPPFAPAAPGWMWAFVNAVPLGSPAAVTATSNEAAVVVPAPSFVRLKMRVAVADPLASLSAIGGTSLAGNRLTVNFSVATGDVLDRHGTRDVRWPSGRGGTRHETGREWIGPRLRKRGNHKPAD
jgi:hypothetical protein